MSIPSSPPSASRESKLAYLFERIATHVCWIVPLLAMLASLRKVGEGWDDGAITAAFARTFAHTGKLALTPTSEQVEGFSSLTWMLVLAAGDRIIHSFAAMLAWSKIASAICFSASLFLFRKIAARFLDGLFLPFAVLLLAFIVTPLTETINGMEMNLYMLLILWLASILLTKERLTPAKLTLAALISWVILCTRFESPYLLFFLYLGVWLEFSQRGPVAWLVSADALFFSAIELWRKKTFGLWLPNTILAKRWPPYSVRGTRDILNNRYDALAELFQILYFPIVLLVLIWAIKRIWLAPVQNASKPRENSPVLWIISVSAILFDLMLGQNWGHPGRMILAFLPFIVLLLVSGYRTIAPSNQPALQIVIFVVVFAHAAAWASLALAATHENLASAARVERVGVAVDHIRRVLHREKLSAFIPDVGASSLCCERLTIFDSALLANRSMAASGFQGTMSFLDANRPDVIETHGPWAQEAGFYTNHYLDGFGVVEADGVFLFVRKDLYRQLIDSGFDEIPTNGTFELCGEKKLPDVKVDMLYMATVPRCIHLTD
jgi:hypothetical protein